MKKTCPLFVFAVACVALWIAPGAVAQEDAAVGLRPQWHTGQTARYHFTNTRLSTSVVNFNGNTQETEITVNSEGDVTWAVESVNEDGSAVGTMTLDWMLASFDAQGEEAVNDSRKNSGDIPFVHDLLKAMTGKPLKVTVNPDGSIKKVEGIKAMRDDTDEPDAVPDETDFIETATDLATVAFAPQGTAPSDTWEADFTWNYGIIGMDIGSLTQPWNYTLVGVETIEGVPVAIVNGEAGKMKLDPSKVQEELPEDAPPVKVKLKDNEATSQVLFDLSRHEAVGRTTTMTTTLEITIPLPNGQDLQRDVTETIVSQTLRIAEE